MGAPFVNHVRHLFFNSTWDPEFSISLIGHAHDLFFCHVDFILFYTARRVLRLFSYGSTFLG